MSQPVSIGADFLARLLLIQNVATIYPDRYALLSFICRGLEDFPGVITVRYQAQYAPDELGTALTDSNFILHLKHSQADFGALLIEVNDKTAFRPYLPYLLNTATMLAVILENRENEERMTLERNQFFDMSWDMLCVAGTDGFFKNINPRWEKTLGWTTEELLSRPFIDFVHPDDVAVTLTELQKITIGETTAGFQNRYRCKNGLFRWLDWSAAARKSVIFAAARDITERKQAEIDLQIAAIAFETQEGVIITDARGVILRVNQAFTTITGYTADDAVGQTPRLLQSGRHDTAFYAAMRASVQRDRTWQGEVWNRRKNGEIYPEWLTVTAVKGEDGAVTHYVGTFIDITERKAAEDEIQHLAFYDPLTQLPNRLLMLNRLQQTLAARMRNGCDGALFFIDLDNFKTLNDTRGHDKGDLLLQQVAERLSACVRMGDTVARLGGDEFVVLLENLSAHPREAATQARIVGEKMLITLNQTYWLAGHKHHSTASIGVTLCSDHPNYSVEELLKHADLALYQAKAAGRNALRFFDPEMQAIVTARATLETELRNGLQQQEFLLYYQPQVDGQGRTTGAEALVRWRHPRRGLVSPAEFIPVAEETGLILPLGHWVLETACTQLVAWSTQPRMTHLTVAVNVSARQFRHPDFVDQVRAVLDHSGVDPQKLELELTESLLLDNIEDTIAKMTAIKAKGVGFSLDDFGTGYSSLAYLKRLPLDQLKIDQSFVRNVPTDPNDAAIVQTIVVLAHSLGLAVIAEGVETEEQRDFLARNGCHAFQGYLFGRPGPVEDLQGAVESNVV